MTEWDEYYCAVNISTYLKYKDQAFDSRFIKPEMVARRVRELESSGLYGVKVLGCSAQGRSISCITIGEGKTDVLIWSQMHGDEPTGTMAGFDLMKYLGLSEDGEWQSAILNQCTVHFVPMLNPDGAALFQRRNIQGIDINRDFLALQSPEAAVLLTTARRLKPQFGFNLHDQSTLWSVSGTKEPAAISLLAPPVDDRATVTPARERAMQLVTSSFLFLKDRIPGHIGRWNDEYEPRAVGETFQSMGISTMLIEAGGYRDDPENQFLRQLNFEVLLHSLKEIATGSYRNQDTSVYKEVPFNNKELFHLLIRNCTIATAGGLIRADVGLNFSEERDESGENRIKVFTVADLGDLSTWNAYETIDAGGAFIRASMKIESMANFDVENEDRVIVSFKNGNRVS